MTRAEWVEMARATMPVWTEEQKRSIVRRRLHYARLEAEAERDTP